MDGNQCQVCLNYFIDHTSLQNHIETHTKRELYTCIVTLKSALSQLRQTGQWFSLSPSVEKNEASIRLSLEQARQTEENLAAQMQTNLATSTQSSLETAAAVTLVEKLNRQTEYSETQQLENQNVENVDGIDMTGASASDLQKYALSVGNGKAFSCDTCGRVFGTSFALRRHTMSHNNERPDKCDICGKGFIGKQNLEVHRRVHTGEKPYACEVCGKKFSQHGSLYKHRERHGRCFKPPEPGAEPYPLDSSHGESDLKMDGSGSFSAEEGMAVSTDGPDTEDGGHDEVTVPIQGHPPNLELDLSKAVSSQSQVGNLPNMNFDLPAQGHGHPQGQGHSQVHDHSQGQDHSQAHAESHTQSQGHSHLHDHVQTPARIGAIQHTSMSKQSSSMDQVHEMAASVLATEENEKGFQGRNPEDDIETSQVENLKQNLKNDDPMLAEEEVKTESQKQEEMEYLLSKMDPSQLSPGRSKSGDDGLQCKFCLIKCASIFELQSHCSKYHTGQKPYRCNVCGKRFSASFCLRRHIMLHTGEKPHRCPYCHKGFIEKQHLQSHIRIHTGEKPYKCHVCSKSFTQYGTLHNHLQTHNKETSPESLPMKAEHKEPTTPEPTPAVTTPQQTSTASHHPTLSHHLAKQQEIPKELENQINPEILLSGMQGISSLSNPLLQFSQALHLQMQLYTRELESRKSSLSQMEGDFEGTEGESNGERGEIIPGKYAEPTPTSAPSKEEMAAAKEAALGKFNNNPSQNVQVKKEQVEQAANFVENGFGNSLGQITAPNVDLSVLSNKELEAMAAAVTDKRHKCDYCQSQFNSPITLERHTRTHRGQKPFLCHYCQKSFTTSYCLRRHVMTHTGERPHACPTCGKRFIEKQHLMIHTRIHTGEKPYQCKYCGKRFPQGGSLYRHVQIHLKGKSVKIKDEPNVSDQLSEAIQNYQLEQKTPELDESSSSTYSSTHMQSAPLDASVSTHAIATPQHTIASSSHQEKLDSALLYAHDILRNRHLDENHQPNFQPNVSLENKAESNIPEDLSNIRFIDSNETAAMVKEGEKTDNQQNEQRNIDLTAAAYQAAFSPTYLSQIQKYDVARSAGLQYQDAKGKSSATLSEDDTKFDVISDMVRRDYLQHQYNFLFGNIDARTVLIPKEGGTEIPQTVDTHDDKISAPDDIPMNLTDSRYPQTEVEKAVETAAIPQPADYSIGSHRLNVATTMSQQQAVEYNAAVETIAATQQQQQQQQQQQHHLIPTTAELHSDSNDTRDTVVSTVVYPCNVCGQQCESLPALVYHLREHTGSTELRCEICGETFTVAEHLIIHYQSHAVERAMLQTEPLQSPANWSITEGQSNSCRGRCTDVHTAQQVAPLEDVRPSELFHHIPTTEQLSDPANVPVTVAHHRTVEGYPPGSIISHGVSDTHVGVIMRQDSSQVQGHRHTQGHGHGHSQGHNGTSNTKNDLDHQIQPHQSEMAATNQDSENQKSSDSEDDDLDGTMADHHPLATSTPSHSHVAHPSTIVENAQSQSVSYSMSDKLAGEGIPKFIETGNILSSFSELASQVMQRNLGRTPLPTPVFPSTSGFQSTSHVEPAPSPATSVKQESTVQVTPTRSPVTDDTEESSLSMSNAKPFVCEICHKQFMNKRSFYRHVRLHTGEQLCKCEICGKGFTGVFGLRRHMVGHSGDKPHKCEFCGKGFIEKQHLESHRRIHTGEKPFKCDFCGKRFTQYGTLHRHKRTHTKEKPYGCPHCPKRFGENRQLTHHLKVHNPGGEVKEEEERGKDGGDTN
ncbi:LOW QUALITY PROTEIN: zinc finger protein Xfin-like [Pecten maximus]|uniref:LOW QUALITY PROTEIN: zinc finger protein Xfin-like n=1 Tax=Pecten maximus TaxID=6579 RepID=UPI001458E684|nr:LOW QUALITY PROTEIN: zinc finger protein Xfin-like [Pecten maximus]